MTALARLQDREPSRTDRPHWQHRLLLLAAVLASAVARAAPAAVTVQRIDSALHVHASATLQADARTVWNTLVGYEQLADFIPDMASSRTLRRDGDTAVVQQRGRAGLGPFKQDFSLTLAVQETPLRSVTAQAMAGDFSRFESSYQLHSGDDGSTRLDYSALIEPRSGIPPLVGVPVMTWAIRRQFNALVAEIERRGARPVEPREPAGTPP